jgi:hypothetical protein
MPGSTKAFSNASTIYKTLPVNTIWAYTYDWEMGPRNTPNGTIPLKICFADDRNNSFEIRDNAGNPDSDRIGPMGHFKRKPPSIAVRLSSTWTGHIGSDPPLAPY